MALSEAQKRAKGRRSLTSMRTDSVTLAHVTGVKDFVMFRNGHIMLSKTNGGWWVLMQRYGGKVLKMTGPVPEQEARVVFDRERIAHAVEIAAWALGLDQV